MAVPRTEALWTGIDDGTVLITGGLDAADTQLASAELYDYVTGAFTSTGPMLTARQQHRIVQLYTGKVLVTGGKLNVTDNYALNSAELYDPATGTFTPTGNMNRYRRLHRSTELANGKILITGGLGGDSNTANSVLRGAEIYDPATGTFSWTSAGEGQGMIAVRRSHQAILLRTGKVLIVGGYNTANNTGLLNSAELYDPDTDTFTATGNMNVARAPFLTMLPDGKVLVSNGSDASGNPLQSYEIYDPGTGSFTLVGNGMVARDGNRVTRLPGGKILLVGGKTTSANTSVTDTAELYSHLINTFTSTDSLLSGRRNFVLSNLPNGRILVAGGVDGSDTVLSSGELYTPWIGDPVDTTITSGPDAFTGNTSAAFIFTSSPAGGTFKCSLDSAAFEVCTSPKTYTSLLTGSHRFRVYATSLGEVDPTPATYNWTIGSIMPTNPADGAAFDTCSYFTLPTFQWNLGETFQKIELQFYTVANPTKPVKVKVKDPTATELLMTTGTWKKILALPGLSGGEVNWKIVGTNKGLPATESSVFTMIIAAPEPVDTPVIDPTSQTGVLPTLEWGNACGTKFKAYFSADVAFGKKKTLSFTDKNPVDEGGNFSSTLTSGVWNAIRKLVGDVQGSTIYWYVESWDVIKRYEKTDTMSFDLEP